MATQRQNLCWLQPTISDDDILEKTNCQAKAVKNIALMDVLGEYSYNCPIFEE